MAWSVGNVGAAVFGNNVDLTPACPVHAAGETLFAAAVFRRKSAADGELISETGSWTQIYDAIGIALFYKVASGSSEADPTFQFTGGAGGDSTGAVVWTTTGGSVTVEDAQGSDNSSNTNVTFPATTIDADCIIFDISCINDNRNINSTSGWTEIVDAGTTLGKDIQIGVQYKTASSDEGSHTATISIARGTQTASIALQVAVTSTPHNSFGLVFSGPFAGPIG